MVGVFDAIFEILELLVIALQKRFELPDFGFDLPHPRLVHRTVDFEEQFTLGDDVSLGKIGMGLGEATADQRNDFQLIAGLLRGERLLYNGKEIKLVWADPGITRQIQLSIVSHGPNGQQLAGELGYPLGVATELQRLGQCIVQVKTGARRGGNPVQDIRLRWSGQTTITDDWQVIKEHRLSQISTFIRERYRLYLQGGMGAEELPVDIDLARRITESYDWLEHASAQAGHGKMLLDYSDDEWRKWLKGQFIGKPEEVIQIIREGLKYECIQEVVLGLHVSTERLSVEQNMEAFAKRVRPFL